MSPAPGSNGAVPYAVTQPGPLVSRDSGTRICSVLSRSFRSITLTSATLTFCPHCSVPGSKAHVTPKVFRPKGHPGSLESTVLLGLAAFLPTVQPRARLVQPGLLGRNVNPQRMEQPLTALVTCLMGLGWQLDMCGRLTGFQSQLSRSHAGSFLRVAKGSGVSFYRNVGSVLCLCFLPHPSL